MQKFLLRTEEVGGKEFSEEIPQRNYSEPTERRTQSMRIFCFSSLSESSNKFRTLTETSRTFVCVSDEK